MEEIWKDVPGFEGLYQASTEGNIRSLNYNGTRGRIQNLKRKENKKGYYRVVLCNKDHKKKEYQWGRVIALTFIPNPENKPEITYIDKDKTNNKPENIKWATYREISMENLEDKHIIYDGKSFRNEKEMAKYYNISETNYRRRKQRGWSVEETLSIPVNKSNCGGKPLYYNYYGKSMTLVEISKQTGIKSETIQRRISEGWDLYSAAETPISIFKRRNKK